jgi:predicted transcriptional regulator
MDNIIMSIQTKYARKIFAGEKKWEFRKNLPRISTLFPSKVIVYSSGDEKAIIGEFTIKQIVKTSFKQLMIITNSNSDEKAIEWFSKYYKNSKVCGAIEIKEVVEYKIPISLEEIKKVDSDFRPPQNFYYLNSLVELKKLIKSKESELIENSI